MSHLKLRFLHLPLASFHFKPSPLVLQVVENAGNRVLQANRTPSLKKLQMLSDKKINFVTKSSPFLAYIPDHLHRGHPYYCCSERWHPRAYQDPEKYGINILKQKLTLSRVWQHNWEQKRIAKLSVQMKCMTYHIGLQSFANGYRSWITGET